jgi:thiol-disulfide isomerase/thioredoxin
MNSFFTKIQKTLKKLPLLNILLVVGVLAAGSYLVYGSCMCGNKKEHFENGENEVICTFYAFDYCGYCKQFKPVWDSVKSKTFDDKVVFRYYESNKMTPAEKKNVRYYVESSFAPNVVLTVNGKNIEFAQQQNVPNKGLEEFISSRGTKYAK